MTHPAGRESRDVAIPRLVDQEGARLLAFARRYCGDGSEAEDLVQETFVQAFRAWDQLQDPSAARSWLYAIARRACTVACACSPRRIASMARPPALQH